ncbi:MAG: DUF2157 domain-containing protein [Alphaproteobacteria bacterium]|nr:DUF2157 domain-containing protein [Alphaproteobacteria bacterium]
MSGLEKRLRRWQSAGLISEDQISSILIFEKNRQAGRFGRGLMGSAIFAIILGVLSLVAANWHAIPGDIKIGVHVCLNAAVGYMLWSKRGHDLWREGLTLAFFGLTLTLLALIGQVYQLGDGTYSGILGLWMIITLPFMAYLAHKKMTVIPWMIAFLGTVWVVVGEHIGVLSSGWRSVFILGTNALLPLALMADGTFRWVEKNRPVWSSVFKMTGGILLAVSASLGSLVWYGEIYRTEMPVLYILPILILAVVGITTHAYLNNFYRTRPEMKYGALFALLSVITWFIPCVFQGVSPAVGSAVLFILYWLGVGWLSQKAGWIRGVSLAVILITVRIFIIYIEVFGSLLMTGWGLIMAGIVMLGLLVVAKKMNQRLTQEKAHG